MALSHRIVGSAQCEKSGAGREGTLKLSVYPVLRTDTGVPNNQSQKIWLRR